ncbi:MAG: glycosyltransferase family 39 protein [Thermodesulfobacteriota bacterium]
MLKLFHKHIPLYFLLIVIALVFRLPGINKQPILDEGYSLKAVNGAWGQIIADRFLDAHPPLFYFLIHLWGQISGNIVWLRLFSVLCGSLVCVLLYHLVLRLFGTQIALISYVLSAISPQLIFVSQYSRPYVLALIFSLLSVSFFINIMEESKEKNPASLSNILLYLLLALLSLYTFYYSIFIILSVFICGIYLLKVQRPFILKWLIGHMLVGFGYLPWFFVQQGQMAHLRDNITTKVQFLHESRMGFYWGEIHIGAILKTFLSVFHFDDVTGSLRYSSHFSFIAFLIVSGAAIAIGIYLLIKGYKFLRRKEKLSNATFLVACLIFVPLICILSLSILGDLGIAGVGKLAINPRYFVQSSILSGVLIAGALLSFSPKLLRYGLITLAGCFFLFLTARVWSFNSYPYEEVVNYLTKNEKSKVVISIPNPVDRILIQFSSLPKKSSLKNPAVISSTDQLTNISEILDKNESFYLWFTGTAYNSIRYQSLIKQFEVLAMQQGYKKEEEKNFQDIIFLSLYVKRN